MGFMPWQDGQVVVDAGGDCGCPAVHNGPLVRARIAKGRVAEMLARGWAVLDSRPESWTMMEGPEIDGTPEPAPESIGSLIPPMLAEFWRVSGIDGINEEEWSTSFA